MSKYDGLQEFLYWQNSLISKVYFFSEIDNTEIGKLAKWS